MLWISVIMFDVGEPMIKVWTLLWVLALDNTSCTAFSVGQIDMARSCLFHMDGACIQYMHTTRICVCRSFSLQFSVQIKNAILADTNQLERSHEFIEAVIR